MKITFEIATDNAAFSDRQDVEVRRIITGWLNRLDLLEQATSLRDINGNTVGKVTVTP